MSDSTPPPADWYPDPTDPTRQRYWDGQQWTSNYAPANLAVAENTPPAAPSPRGSGLTTWAMIAGIVAIGLAIIPGASFVAGLPAIAAVVLAAMGLRQKRPGRGKAITGLILGVLAMIISFFVSVVFIGSIAMNDSPRAAVSSDAATDEPAIDPASFKEVDERTYALLVKDPDASIGQQLIVYGNVFQFDAATGKCSFLANTSHAMQANSFDYEHNALATGGDGEDDCPILDPVVEGDNVKLWVTVLGSLSYETQIGGNTTVPHFAVEQVEILPATEF